MATETALRIASPESAAVDDGLRGRALPAREGATTAARSGAALASVRQVQQCRSIAIVGQIVTIAVAQGMGVAVPALAMYGVVALLVLAHAWTAHRLHRATRTSALEVLGHVAFDIAIVTALLLLSGGTTNPFVMLYLLYVALLALLLPPRLAVVGTTVVFAGWWLCLQFGLPLVLDDGNPIPLLWMKAGRWVSFLLCTGLIAWFVSHASAALQAHQVLLQEAARKALNDEAMLRIGAIAAGAAHELGTPLTTMSVVLKEWQREGARIDYERDASILRGQVAACKQALLHLRAAAAHGQLDEDTELPVDRYVEDIVRRFQLMRPAVRLSLRHGGVAPTPSIAADAGFTQSVLVLLNNSGDVSPEHVLLDVTWTETHLRLAVSDHGTGIPAAVLTKLGRTFVTTKAPGAGTGLGLMLTASTVARLGGTVNWSNQPEGGVRVELRVPLSSLQRPNH